ncbi:MAG: flagellin [Roseburia sp.]|nr:flagellin [Ruminococcus sp.]MCM1154852.1 flagellin [Roseburia sp.]MCM1242465.1 flagellin [Roseburia sp.]
MIVKHNITAMNANRMFNLTVSSQAKSTEKLSSGYKINRAADDAAGLSISEKMRRQVRGLTQASANAADGISCVQTAEGALNEVHDMLQRINELAVKGANGTLTSIDRSYITMEVRQLMSEIDRVQSTTTFNEQNLLDGTFSNKQLQVGAEAGQHIAITIGNMCTNELIASALSKGIFYYTSNNSSLCDDTDNPHPLEANYQIGDIAYWIPGKGTTWAKEEYWQKDTVAPWGTPGHAHLLGAYDLTIFHSFSYSAITDENVKDKLTDTFTSLGAPGVSGGTEEDLSDTVPDARHFQALNAFAKSAIADVSQTRSDLGAIQNRLEHTISNLDNIVENTASAESSIRDTDISTEMVRYSNNSILAQAGQSMLVQANQQNQGVLSLLQ